MSTYIYLSPPGGFVFMELRVVPGPAATVFWLIQLVCCHQSCLVKYYYEILLNSLTLGRDASTIKVLKSMLVESFVI